MILSTSTKDNGVGLFDLLRLDIRLYSVLLASYCNVSEDIGAYFGG